MTIVITTHITNFATTNFVLIKPVPTWKRINPQEKSFYTDVSHGDSESLYSACRVSIHLTHCWDLQDRKL